MSPTTCNGCGKRIHAANAWRWEEDDQLYCKKCRAALDDSVPDDLDMPEVEPLPDAALAKLVRPPRKSH